MKSLTIIIFVCLFQIIFSSFFRANGQSMPPLPPDDVDFTNCPPYTNSPTTLSPDRSIIDLNIGYVGTLRLALYDRDKPATVSAFLNYVISGAYSNNIIHYDATNFVVQGGSLRIIDFGNGEKAVVPVAENAPVTNELGSGQLFSNVRGTIALVHYPGETNNATCHWFINLADNTSFDSPDTNHSYVVFGHVISGITNLDKLNPSATNTTIKLMNLGGWLNSCPVNYSATPSTVTYSNLLTVTYNLIAMDVGLKAQKLTNNAMLLSWQSVSNKQQTIYFKPEVGGSNTWAAMWSTNGNGAIQSFQHSTNVLNGFYRLSFQP